MAARRALRILQRPLYSGLSRTLPASTSISTLRILSPFPLCQRDALYHGDKLAPVAYSRFFAANAGETASKSGVVEVADAEQYNNLLKEAKENKKLAVVYFTAKWCGPCRHISPEVDKLSGEFKDVKFLKVDLDEPELQYTVDAAGISAVPTFQFHSQGKMVAKFSGADSKTLRSHVEELWEEAKGQ